MTKILRPVCLLVVLALVLSLVAVMSLATSAGAVGPWTQTIDDAPGMDVTLWHDDDFSWTHSGFESGGQKIGTATLEIRAWDVDWSTDPDDEHNVIYVDGNEVGELTGEDDEWSVTTFTIASNLATTIFADGEAEVFVDVDATHDSNVWAVDIDWSTFTVTTMDFSASPTMGDAPLTVKFQDRSRGGATWHWSFGDGNTSTARNPEHTYQHEGFYTVTLTVDGAALVKNDLILVESQAVAARLVVRDLNITPAYAQPRQAVGVSANVFNDGGTWGSGTVNLMINGQFEQSVSVGVSPGTAQPVSFIVYKVDPGEYQVGIDGAVGTFYVVAEARAAPQGGGLLAGGELDQGGIIAIIVIAVILVGGVVVAIILTRPS